jgi:hypothetical protein
MPTLNSVCEPVREKSGTSILVTAAPVPVIGMAFEAVYEEQGLELEQVCLLP